MTPQQRFKELTNLHLDHRLNPGEALELEQLLQSDPALRREFAVYKAMQGGCEELFRRSLAGAPASQRMLRALREADRKVEHAPARARGWAWNLSWLAGGGMATAAAVFAVMVVRVNTPALSVAEQAPATDSAPARMVAAETRTILVAAAATPAEVAPAAAPVATTSTLEVNRSLAPRLTLAAVGIANESREVGAVSRWSYALDDANAQELERAAAWTRGDNRPEWSLDAATAARYGASPSAVLGGSGSVFQATAASFTFER
jgi:hypothetical protein